MIHNCLLVILCCTMCLFFLIFVTCPQPRTQQESFSILQNGASGHFRMQHSQSSILDQVVSGQNSIIGRWDLFQPTLVNYMPKCLTFCLSYLFLLSLYKVRRKRQFQRVRDHSCLRYSF